MEFLFQYASLQDNQIQFSSNCTEFLYFPALISIFSYIKQHPPNTNNKKGIMNSPYPHREYSRTQCYLSSARKVGVPCLLLSSHKPRGGGVGTSRGGRGRQETSLAKQIAFCCETCSLSRSLSRASFITAHFTIKMTREVGCRERGI